MFKNRTENSAERTILGDPKTIHVLNLKLSKQQLLVNKAANFFQVILFCMSIIRIDTSKTNESLKVTISDSKYESCVDLIDRNDAIFTVVEKGVNISDA